MPESGTAAPVAAAPPWVLGTIDRTKTPLLILFSLVEGAASRTPSATPAGVPDREFSSDREGCAGHRILRFLARANPGPFAPCRLHRRAGGSRALQFRGRTISDGLRESVPRRPPAGASDPGTLTSGKHVSRESRCWPPSERSDGVPGHRDLPSC